MTIDLSPEGRNRIRESVKYDSSDRAIFYVALLDALEAAEAEMRHVEVIHYENARRIDAAWKAEMDALKKQNEAAEAQNEKMKAMLKKLEWTTDDWGKLCPICSFYKDTPPNHSPDCALAALLK